MTLSKYGVYFKQMKNLKSYEIVDEARKAADKFTCQLGGHNAERVLKLAYEKVKAKNDLLKIKYKEIEK